MDFLDLTFAGAKHTSANQAKNYGWLVTGHIFFISDKYHSCQVPFLTFVGYGTEWFFM